MNKELEALILAYEKFSAAKDLDAEKYGQDFESLLDATIEKRPAVSREMLRKAILRAHSRWAMKQQKKPPSMPPSA